MGADGDAEASFKSARPPGPSVDFHSLMSLFKYEDVLSGGYTLNSITRLKADAAPFLADDQT
jgi:hypothetical protein